MEFTPFQKDILDWLKDNPNKNVPEINKGTGISEPSVRRNLDILIAKGEVIVDKKRQPYEYQIDTNSESVEWRRMVASIKQALLSDSEPNNPILKTIWKSPRGNWDGAERYHAQISEALKDIRLNSIPTLETPVPNEQKSA